MVNKNHSFFRFVRCRMTYAAFFFPKLSVAVKIPASETTEEIRTMISPAPTERDAAPAARSLYFPQLTAIKINERSAKTTKSPASA